MFKSKSKSLARLAAIIAALILLACITPLSRPAVFAVLRSPFRFFSFVGREVNGLVFFHRNMAQNERFRKENELLRQGLRQFDELFLENKRLTQLLSLKQQLSYRTIPARVISRSPDNWASIVVADKGASHGVRRGAAVVSYAGLVGRVSEVSGQTCTITLINDPDMSVSAIVQRSRQEGLISGTLASYLIMKYLPKDADVAVNDAVVTSGLTGVYPKGVPVGIVSETGEEFSGLSRYAIIRPAANLSNTEEVLIVVP